MRYLEKKLGMFLHERARFIENQINDSLYKEGC